MCGCPGGGMITDSKEKDGTEYWVVWTWAVLERGCGWTWTNTIVRSDSVHPEQCDHGLVSGAG